MAFIFDIETGPLPADQLEAAIEPMLESEPFPEMVPFDPKSVKLGQMKDQAKIDAKIESDKQKHVAKYKADKTNHEEALAEKRAKLINKAALSPETGRVLAIGFKHDNGNGDPHTIDGDGLDESALLAKFWIRYSIITKTRKDRLVGWNCKRFDMPFLILRSWILGVAVPQGLIEKERYISGIMVDLMDLWKIGNGGFASLDSAARALGVGRKTGSGADFARLWSEDRPAAIAYLKNDLDMTADVAFRMGVA